MTPKHQLLVMVAVAVAAALGGYVLAQMLSEPVAPVASRPMTSSQGVSESPEALIGQPRPDFSLSGLQGEAITAAGYDGQVLLLNFWATWCAPCVEEMPMLSELATTYADQGFTVLGVAIDDPGKAGEFVAEMNLAYPIAIGTTENAVTGRRYGNRSGMLPYSVLIDRAGTVRWTLLGAVERDELVQQLQDLL